MYHALLTNRYLTSRVIPFIAVAAVALCVALVIIVVSVMTGFLDMVKSSGRTLMGDVVVSFQVRGIPHYDRLIARINALPEAVAATPVVDGLAIMRMPYPDGTEKHTAAVQFWGIEPISFSEVTGYEGTLKWRELTQEQREWLLTDVIVKYWSDVFESMSEDQKLQLARRAWADPDDPQRLPDEATVRNILASFTDADWESLFVSLRFEPDVIKQSLTESQWNDLLSNDPRLLHADRILKEGLTMRRGEGDDADDRTITLGIHVSQGNERQKDGSYKPVGKWWMPRHEVTLTTIPTGDGSLGGADSAESRVLSVVNEFASGVFLIDERRVMLPLSVAQSMLHLNEADQYMDSDNPSVKTGVEPAKATMVLVRAAPNVTAEHLRDAVADAYDKFVQEIADDPTTTRVPPARGLGVTVQTWLQQQASFIGPVEKEREMMRILFSIIYLVCAGLILAIFWAIVHEKTRDIGILRSIGASRGGILWIFLRYGLIVGVIGSIAGLGLATMVVRNINEIHAAIGEDAPWWLWLGLFASAISTALILLWRIRSRHLLFIVLCTLVLVTMLILVIGLIFHRGTLVWDPSVYYFSKIPNQVDMATGITTMIGAVVFSLLGAFIPAAKAADIEPVHALRYE